ncbi:hypothetical protein C8J57DRAFT_159122 [Mycena rebaudengoi]|nr:hypothetical protein C8J57DRAFT_159122 [Mycena rebaudengoi]
MWTSTLLGPTLAVDLPHNGLKSGPNRMAWLSRCCTDGAVLCCCVQSSYWLWAHKRFCTRFFHVELPAVLEVARIRYPIERNLCSALNPLPATVLSTPPRPVPTTCSCCLSSSRVRATLRSFSKTVKRSSSSTSNESPSTWPLTYVSFSARWLDTTLATRTATTFATSSCSLVLSFRAHLADCLVASVLEYAVGTRWQLRLLRTAFLTARLDCISSQLLQVLSPNRTPFALALEGIILDHIRPGEAP